jgi:hypothetical protein
MRGVFIVALLALGCAATATLRAKPDNVCAGRAVRLTWDGSHSGEISATPAEAGLGEVEASGQKTVKPRATTTYRFRAESLLSSATSEATVKVVEVPDKPAAIRGSAGDDGSGCSPGKLWVTARVPGDAWDSRLRVHLVSSSDGRAYRVQHAAREADVRPDAPSSALRDLPLAGAWRIETALRAGESCGDGSAPESLGVDVSFVCAD